MVQLNRGMFTSAREDWETPDELYDKYNRRYHFTVDVCADEKNHKCARYFTKDQDGLKQNWDGERCWCNPPYGKAVAEFVKKAVESKALTVMLIPARTDTMWFHTYIYMRYPVEFIKGRITFKGAKHNAPFPSMIVIVDNLSE